MPTKTIDFAALAAQTPKSEAKTRKGPGGTMLTYVDARFVMDRLDSVVGPARWSDSYTVNPDGSVQATITIDGVSKSDVGVPSKIEPAKGAYSDAFKRAAVKWGIGRDLYDEESEVRSNKPAQVEQAERAVVGQTGLTDKQRGLLFAKIKEAGITGDQRKALAFIVVQKHSIKDMTPEDLDKLVAFLDAPRSENADMWENILLASAE